MKHAFLIMAHQEPEVLLALLRLLDDERNDIFLHIDRRAADLNKAVADLRLEHARLFRVEPSAEVGWGDLSQVETELRCFEAAHRRGTYAYYHLLSGVDLPIKTMDELHAFFSTCGGREFIGFWNDEHHRRDLQRKISRRYFFTRYFKRRPHRWRHRFTAPLRNIALSVQKMARYRRRHIIDFQKGFNWCSITHGFCTHLLEHRACVRRIFRHTLCPDEIYKQTLVWHSPFRAALHDTDDPERGSLRRIDWQRGNPYVWQVKDIDELMRCELMFARKFSAEAAAEIVRRLVRPSA
ncbi:glycosyl transferase [Alloprevotella sp. OH1205_COT-284]|uniref:beta-1,6-N-acetylglucosaminyltransferase n=1 Tax=Alloprevotella sp. OH1205_COT-284 TaxID=2491043 RepID=UPI000F5D9E78|nr:beta-1,6-N-acetylglucosaminyltransferase [Alloprevotella sp. OH1205_COT-284]RRD80254.1 glycosyl transferase [Alloprevotella sp. OH1205_COT-284]